MQKVSRILPTRLFSTSLRLEQSGILYATAAFLAMMGILFVYTLRQPFDFSTPFSVVHIGLLAVAVLGCVFLNNRKVALFVLLCVVLYISLMSRFEYMTEYPETHDIYDSAEIVVARYKENLNWLGKQPFSNFTHIIYNKGSDENFYTNNKTTAVIKLPNVGKCDHTYLYHIVQNYDKLKEITIFLPGSVEMSFKIGNATRIIDSLYTNKSSTVVGHPHTNVASDLANFTLDKWKTSDSVNYDDDVPDNTELAQIRPFGEWYKHHFGDLFIDKVSPFGIMAISRKHIHNHPKSYYEKLITELDKSSNPEAGHFFERAWIAIFHPMDDLVAL